MTDPKLSILLYLIGGREIRLGIDPEEWASAFHDALVKNEAIQIDDPSGQGKFGINPLAILYWKAMPDPPKGRGQIAAECKLDIRGRAAHAADFEARIGALR